MKIKIYRGTHQIGGCVVGVSTEHTRILIDMGKQMADTEGNTPLERLSIDEPYDAVIFTHYHSDHIGLMEYIAPNIPLYIGKTAREIFMAVKEQEGSPLTERIKAMHTYEDGKPFSIGDLHITPLLADHSAFDAYMLVIEGDGKKLLHTGDFRLHGLKGQRTAEKFDRYRNQVDLLITEGTNLSYKNPITTEERKLEEAARVIMERFPYTFVLCSPTDFDRLSVFYRAAESKGSFFCDAYQMKLFEILRKSGSDIDGLYDFSRAKVYLEDLKEKDDGFCMTVRNQKAFQSVIKPYLEKGEESCLFISSVPEGYLRKHQSAVEKLAAGFRYRIKLHTSGHASSEALWEAVRRLQPKKIIPVHTEKPEKIRLGAFQSSVLFLEDGDSYDIL